MTGTTLLTLLTLGFLVGLDNLQVAGALGTLDLKPLRRWWLALTFGLCEGLMPLLGLALGDALRRALASWPSALEALAPAALLICGLAILIGALRGGEAGGAARGARWWLFGLPLTLSVDNLFAGFALGSLGFPRLLSALMVGLISLGMALLGLYLGHSLRRGLGRVAGRWVPERVEVVSGLLMLTLAVIHLI